MKNERAEKMNRGRVDLIMTSARCADKEEFGMKRKQGFTLVELVIVIAILGLIAVVGLRQYGTVRQKQAQKMDAAQMRHIAHAIEAYDLVNENDSGRFDNFDSLIDCTPSGSRAGTAVRRPSWTRPSPRTPGWPAGWAGSWASTT